MFLQPKKTKFKKYRKGKIQLKSSSFKNLQYGSIGIKCLKSGKLNNRQIEAIRQNISRGIKRKGKLWMNVFPDIPVSSKPSEVRMGKGKGDITNWISKISAGKVIIELEGIPEKISLKVLNSVSKKLPFKTYIIKL